MCRDMKNKCVFVMCWVTKSVHVYLSTHTSACAALSCHGRVCVCMSVCLSDARASEYCIRMPHLQFTAASLAHCPNLCLLTLVSFLFSSVHCFGLQLLYLFRLTGGLALPLGFRMGNGVAEKGIDNRNRQGLEHPRYSPPNLPLLCPNINPKTNKDMFISFPLYLFCLL